MQKIPADVFVRSFLSAANEQEIGAVVIYGAVINGQPVLRAEANRDADTTQKIMGLVLQQDTRAVTAAAQYVHDLPEGCVVCDAQRLREVLAGQSGLAQAARAWSELPDDAKVLHVQHVCRVFAAARFNAPAPAAPKLM